MVVGVIAGLGIAFVTSGLVFAPVGDIRILEIRGLLLDGRGSLTVALV